MFVKEMFGFSFGGENDFGRMTETVGHEKLDFASKPTGIGYAIRNGKEANMDNKKMISVCFETDSDIDISLEFKTQNSNGAPEVEKSYEVKKGVANIVSPIPENLTSPLQEIVIFFPRNNGRTDDVNISFGGVCLF